MPQPRPGNIVRLRDGRVLGYGDYGEPGGRPVLYFHGIPGSRILPQGEDARLRARGIRVIAPERPGIGLSDPSPGRSLPGWARDVADLADQLGIERFSVAGYSSGGPYALACGEAMPDRVHAIALVSSDVPPSLIRRDTARFGVRAAAFAQRSRFLSRAEMAALGFMTRRAGDWMLRRSIGSTSDRAVLRDPAMRRLLLRDWRESFRQGAGGPAADLRLTARTWGVRLDGVEQRVHLWHGVDDTFTPPALARLMAARLPRCRATFIPGAGHLWLLDHLADVVEEVAPPH